MLKIKLMKKYLSILLVGCFGLLLVTWQNSNPPPASKPVEEAVSSQPRGSSSRSKEIYSEMQILEFAERWEQSSSQPQEQEQILTSLKKIRSQRQELMREDPQNFLATTLSLKSYAALPKELQPYVDRPYSAIGNMNVQWATSKTEAGRLVCTHQNAFTSEGESFQIIQPKGQTFPATLNQAVNGVALGNQLLLSSENVRMLDSEELDAAKTLFSEANPDGIDPITGEQNASIQTVIGGNIIAFAQAESMVEIEDRVSKQEPSVIRWLAGDQGGNQGSTDADATPFQTNQMQVLFIRVDFSDFPGEPVSKIDLEATLASVDGHFDNYSYGDAGITYTVSDNLYRMPSQGAAYASDFIYNDTLHYDARQLAAVDFTLENYDVVAVFFPDISESEVPGSEINYGGFADIGAPSNRPAYHWINGQNNVGVILHEFGHNFGLYHANYYNPEEDLSADPDDYDVPGSFEYGDIFDTMGNGDEPEGHFNPLAKNQLQWIPDNKVAEANADGTWRIYRFDHIDAKDNATLALKVPMVGEINYWVGFRQLYTSSSYNLSNAAYVVGENMAQNRETSLIDMTPESKGSETEDRKDAGLPVGSSYYDAAAGVTFETLAKGGSEPDQWIDVQITFDPRVSFRDTVMEVDEQIGHAQVVLQRAYQSAGALSIDYATSDGTAIASTDYYAASGTVTWADGDSTDKIIYIPIRPDLLNEGTEDLTLTLSNPVGGVLDTGKNTLSLKILDPGQRYTTFAPPQFNTTVSAIVPLEDGKVIIGGSISSGIGDFDSIRHIARLNADGSVDSSFVSGSGFNAAVNVIVPQSDGKLLVAGDFTAYNGTACPGLARLSENGILDTSFVSNLGTGPAGEIYAMARESDGGILVGGDFATFDGVNAEGLIRLNENGTRNTTSALNLPFNTGWNTEIRCMLVESDGKIMVGGSFYIGSTGTGFKSGIIRLNSNGTEDGSFNPDAGAHDISSVSTLSRVFDIQKQTDGKYLITGTFSAYDENAAQYMARITSTGAFDATFTPPAFGFNASEGTERINNLIIQANDRFVISGNFITPVRGVERLDLSGTADPTFYQQDGVSFSTDPADIDTVRVYALEEDSGGQLWLGGNFFSYQGISTRPVIRIAGGISPYELWVKENFTDAQILAGVTDPDDDPDNDDINNLAELAMGTDPNTIDAESLFAVDAGGGVNIVEDGGQQYLQISFSKPSGSEGPWYSAQFSGDLSIWSPASPTPGSSEIVVIENSSTTYTVRDTVPISPSNPRFGRIVLQAAE